MVLKANKELAEKNLHSNKKSIKEKMNLTA
jgi:hypothetical protein